MGSFDSFLTRCPDCGAQMEWQSKARYGYGGDFEYYTEDRSIERPDLTTVTALFGAPVWLRTDLIGDEQTCRPCGRRVKLDGDLVPQRMLNRGRKFD